MNDMGDYDAYAFRTSSQTYENLSFSGIYGGIHTFSQLAVTSRSTWCIVSVPVETSLQPNPTRYNANYTRSTKILSIYTSPPIYILRYPNYLTNVPTIKYLHIYMYATCKYSSNHNQLSPRPTIGRSCSHNSHLPWRRGN